MATAVFIISFLLLLSLGTPIFVVMGFTAMAAFLVEGEPLIGVAQGVADVLNSSTLMAIPFFVMAATFMQQGGVSRALIDVASTWVRWVPGGLGIVCVAATTVFAAICGSSTATALAMGVVLIPEMLARGYERRFAVGVVGASGTLGILIPPSLAMIVFAILADESVPRLFLAGVIPGLLQALIFSIYIMFYTRRAGYAKEPPPTREEFVRTTLRAMPALSLPVIVLGGIYGGLTTVTEAAALSAAVALALSIFFYRQTALGDVLPQLAQSIMSAATIMIVIGTAIVFGHWVTMSGAAAWLIEVVAQYELSSWQFLLIINITFIVLGMFLEVISLMLITLPLILPLLGPLGIDPVHFAVVVVINMELAVLTPPVGLNLYVLTSISDAGIAEVVRGIAPFLVLLVGLLLLVTYVPEISLFLPRLVYG
jgi:C4-dicarboxylate transporter, DctM subunit